MWIGLTPARNRPTMPVGKKYTLKINSRPSHSSQRSGCSSPGSSGNPASAAALDATLISACR